MKKTYSVNPRICPVCRRDMARIYETRVNKKNLLIRWHECVICKCRWKTVELHYPIVEELMEAKIELDESRRKRGLDTGASASGKRSKPIG